MRRRGFTLIELLIVIGIIALLIAFLLPSLKRAWEQARQVQCMSNLRQVSAAYLSYCAANNSRLYPCDTQTAQQGLPSPDQVAAIPELMPYARDPRVFHCPEDEHVGQRSYAINDYLGGSFPAPNLQHVGDLKDVQNSARTFLFIEETPSPGLVTPMGGFVVLPYPAEVWADAPGVLHNGGTCLSFVDGHCEYRSWVDDRTRNVWSKLPFYHTPKNADLLELQRLEGFGKVPQQ